MTEELEDIEEVEDVETGDDLAEEETDEDGIYTVKDEDLEELDEDEAKKEKAETETKAKADEKDDSFEQKFKDLESKSAGEKKKVHDLNKALHLVRTELKETKKTKIDDGEAVFTDAQLVGLLEEHKDDPAGMLQIMKHVSGQATKAKGKETLNEVEISGNKKELESHLYKTYPDLKTEGSNIRTDVDQVKTKLGLEDHPYGDFFATGSLLLLNIENVLNDAREQGKKAALTGKAEDNRKKDIKGKSLSGAGSGKKGGQKVTPSKVLQVAKQMNLTPQGTKIYANMMAKKTVSVED